MATARSEEDSSPSAPLPSALRLNLPGSGPCRPGFSQLAAAGIDWGGPGRRYHRPAPRCSYHRMLVGRRTRTAGSLTSHSDTRNTLGCTWKHTQFYFIYSSVLLSFLIWEDQVGGFRLLTVCIYSMCIKFTYTPPTIHIHTVKKVKKQHLNIHVKSCSKLAKQQESISSLQTQKETLLYHHSNHQGSTHTSRTEDKRAHTKLFSFTFKIIWTLQWRHLTVIIACTNTWRTVAHTGWKWLIFTCVKCNGHLILITPLLSPSPFNRNAILIL